LITVELDRCRQGTAKVFPLCANGAAMFMAVTDEKYQALNETLSELMALGNRLGKENYEGSIGESNRRVSVFALMLAVAVNLVMARLITEPVKESVEVIKKVAEGDLTRDIRVLSRDEIGELAESVNAVRKKMGEAVGQRVHPKRFDRTSPDPETVIPMQEPRQF